MKIAELFEQNPITADYMQANPDPSKEMEEVTDLAKFREKRQRETYATAMMGVLGELDDYVESLITGLVSKGVDEKEAAQAITSRLSDLVMAYDLRNS